jgi:shikimate dehydrogenase
MDRYVIIGNPVAHSLSPEIHAHFARAAQVVLEYTRLPAPPGGFAATARAFFDAGGAGANVTLPFKGDAFAFADAASERARAAGAANFLARRGASIAADNTDGAGLIADLEGNLGVALAGASILVLGAGGAAQGVLPALLARGPRRLVIANRSVERAAALAQRFGASGPVTASTFASLPAGRFDLVVNATSASLQGAALAVPESLFAPGVLAYDMAYGAPARAFLARAEAAGARASDGMGMLVEQAAESFYLWRGVRPETAGILAQLRSPRA